MTRSTGVSTAQRLTRRNFLGTAAVGCSALLLASCGGSQSAPQASPSAAAGGGSPQASGQPAAAVSSASEDALASLAAAAKREGEVVVFGPLGPQTSTQIPAAFEKRYGVKVLYTAGAIGDLATRLLSERRASLYSTDVAIGGAQTQATVMWDAKLHDPIRPILVDPVVTDPSKWKTGKLLFLDPDDQYILRITYYVTPLIAVNTDLVKVDTMVDSKELLDPKWRGKIVTTDPRLAGTASNAAALLYVKFGQDFLKQFYVDQQVTIMSPSDERQAADDTARGKYALYFAGTDRTISPMTKLGLPIEMRQGFRDLPGYTTSGSGLVALINKAPHPNAAKLFVNWLAGPEGMEIYCRSQSEPSNRNDLDESWVPPVDVPKPGVQYFDSYDWTYTIKTKPETTQVLKKLLPN
jgi:iron(III) transport system substrate-binding protein